LSSLWLVTAGLLTAGGVRYASAQLLTGDILVVDEDAGPDFRGALFHVDPVSGARTLLSDFGNLGQGPLGGNPQAVAVEIPGTILVVDDDGPTGSPSALFRVDPVTGTRTLLSDFGNVAQGPTALSLKYMAVEAAGTILVIDDDAGTDARGGLFRVDPVTGIRTLLSDFGNAAQGPLGRDPLGVVAEATGTILVVDEDTGTNDRGVLFHVDPVSGARTLLSDFGDPAQGPLGSDPMDVAVEAAGTILVIDRFGGTIVPTIGSSPLPALFRVDPVSGARTLLSDFGNAGQGPLGADSQHIAVELTGTILATDRHSGLLFRVDPMTGVRTVVSDFREPTQGPEGRRERGVAVVRNRLFDALSARLTVELNPATNTQTFQVTAPFTLAADSDGIDPLTETVAFRVGAFAGILLPGSFTLVRKGRYAFTGNVDGVPTTVQIRSLRGKQYEARLSAAVNPRSVLLLLQIGDDAGVVGILP
jgi:hypothetical protein